MKYDRSLVNKKFFVTSHDETKDFVRVQFDGELGMDDLQSLMDSGLRVVWFDFVPAAGVTNIVCEKLK